jgi:hypothetical protein
MDMDRTKGYVIDLKLAKSKWNLLNETTLNWAQPNELSNAKICFEILQKQNWDI